MKETVQSNKKILFFLTHPAHFHLFKNSINSLRKKGFALQILITTKDVLEDLVQQEGWPYHNLFPEGRRLAGMPILLSTGIFFAKTGLRLSRYVRENRPNLLVGTDGTLAHVGGFFKIPSILFNEDDSSATPENYIVYPFATKVVLPECCDVGQWKAKRISYNGYHELAYLHPSCFFPDERAVKPLNGNGQRYFILRLAELTASHDSGKRGIADELALKIISIFKKHGQVYISAERPLLKEFEPYRLPINTRDIFHALYFADLYVGDSQTMAAEAAVLGTPSIRFSDFVGKLGYLRELEEKYELTYGIPSSQEEVLINRIEQLLQIPDLKEQWRKKRQRMLDEKVDVSSRLTEIIETQISKKEN